jgi:hypothetical protein
MRELMKPLTKESTIFIAGPMSNIEDFNIPLFLSVEKELISLKYTRIFNPGRLFDPHANEAPKPWEYYMKQTITELMRADLVIKLPDSYKSKGASLEIYIAQMLNIDTITWDDFLKFFAQRG